MSTVTYLGKTKINVCQKLTFDWARLADYFDITSNDRKGFEKGREPEGVWEWLKDRDKLDKLAQALEGVERMDLLHFLRTWGYVIFQSKQRGSVGDAETIFLSYVCEEAWIEQFIKDCTRLFSIDIQRRETEGNPADPATLAMLENAAVVLLLVSQDYLTSAWYQSGSEFITQLTQRLENRRMRLFIIEQAKIAPETRPVWFEQAHGVFRFWETGQHSFQPGSQPYANVLDDIKQQLQTLKASPQAQTEGTSTLAEPRATVLLAEVTDDLYQLREEIKRYLLQRHIRVLPEAYYPLEPKAFQQAVRQDLDQSQLFVQLLSSVPFDKRPDLPQGRVRCQHELAVETQKPVMQWRSSELVLAEIQDPAQRDFLQRETVFAVGIEEFKDEVVKRAAPPKAPSRKTLPCLVVKWESSDADLMDELFEELKKFSEIRFHCPPYAETKNKLTTKLLRNSDGLMILYGKVSPAWVHEQYEEVLEIRDLPFVAQGIYEGPPQEKARLPFHDPTLHILNCRECVKEEELRRFVNLLQAGGAT